jgi:hypothetical protein
MAIATTTVSARSIATADQVTGGFELVSVNAAVIIGIQPLEHPGHREPLDKLPCPWEDASPRLSGGLDEKKCVFLAVHRGREHICSQASIELALRERSRLATKSLERRTSVILCSRRIGRSFWLFWSGTPMRQTGACGTTSPLETNYAGKGRSPLTGPRGSGL